MTVIESADLTVEVLPDNGCDIHRIVDRATGVDVLAKSPWGLRAPTPRATSQENWLERYGGGWQVLCPNAGEERVVDGVHLGYHGEAAIVPWTVDAHESDRLEASVDLFTVPLRIERRLTVDGPAFVLRETVRNGSPDPARLMWVHHPGFGAPLVDAGARLATGARTVIADAEAPGTVLAPDAVHDWPHAGDVDLSLLLGPGSGRAVFACLTDFDEPWFSVTNPRLGFGVELRWPAEIFPHAWFWQEMNASPGFPWYRRAYVAAIEPANVLPGQGTVDGRERGGGLELDGGAEVTVELRLTRFAVQRKDEVDG